MVKDDFEHVSDRALGREAERAHSLDELRTNKLQGHAAGRWGGGGALLLVDGGEEALEQVHVVDEREQVR